MHRCDTCQASFKHRTDMPTYGGEPNSPLIILPHPRYDEIERDKPLVSRAYTPLIAGLNPIINKCSILHAFGCDFTGEKVGKAEIANCAKSRVDEAIALIKPKFVLLVGTESYRAVLGKSTLTRDRGKVIERDGIKYLPTIHPASTYHQPDSLTLLLGDLEHFKRLVKGIKPDMTDFSWENSPPPLGAKYDFVVYDLETTSLDSTEGKILMVGARGGVGKLDNIKWSPVYVWSPEEYPKETRRLFAQDAKFIGHNVTGFDNQWLYDHYGIEVNTYVDTLGAVYLLNENLPHDLKWEARTRYGAGDYALEPPFPENPTAGEWTVIAEYCAKDIYYTSKLFVDVMAELNGTTLSKIMHLILMPTAQALNKVHRTGIKVDKARLEAETQELKNKLEELKAVLDTHSKGTNWSSPKQVAKVLYEDYRYPVLNATPTGSPSTDESTLKALYAKKPSPMIKALLEYRTMGKLLSGFLTPWKGLLSPDDRLHPKYKPFRTVTGRLAAEKPNLQQVPRGSTIRSLMVASKGWKIVEADYSQIELRIAAFISRDAKMLNIYNTGGDIHTSTAMSITGKTKENITKEDRTGAKAVNFGFLYGMWWKGFQEYAFDTYGVVLDDKTAREYREKFFETYPALSAWHRAQARELRVAGEVRSPIGRVRRLANVNSIDDAKVREAERMAINFPVQSMASDICLLAVASLSNKLDPKKARIVGQVHDSVLFEVKEDCLQEILPIIKADMENVTRLDDLFGVDLDVPIVVDIKVGNAWGQGEEWRKK